VTRLGELSTVRVIRTLGADRYAPAGSLCSEVCRSTLDFYHWDSLVGGALEELLRHVERGVANGMHAQLTVPGIRAQPGQGPRRDLPCDGLDLA
jgi:hypothetical protein